MTADAALPVREQIRTHFLGELFFLYGDRKLKSDKRRAYKTGLLLVYLILNRRRSCSTEELVRLMGGYEKNAAPENAMRTMIFRVRRQFADAFGEEFKDCIISSGSGYRWNPDIPLFCDSEEFEALCIAADREADSEKKIGLYERAFSLYQGHFLAAFPAEEWLISLRAHYEQALEFALSGAIDVYLELGRAAELIPLLKLALASSPYSDELNKAILRAHMDGKDYESACDCYERYRRALQNDLGVLPDEEARSLYAKARSFGGSPAVMIDKIMDALREERPAIGAAICDFPTFKMMYRSEARSASRRGDAIHIGMLEIVPRPGQKLRQEDSEKLMDELGHKIQENLRTCDVAARCSESQYVIMLIQANYENSEMVLSRITKAMRRTGGRSGDIDIRSAIVPLEPA